LLLTYLHVVGGLSCVYCIGVVFGTHIPQ